MAPHDLVFVAGVLTFGILEIITSLVTGDRRASSSSRSAGRSESLGRRMEDGVSRI